MMGDPTQTTNDFSTQSNYDVQSEININGVHTVRSLTPEDVQKMKYKIDLDKQVAEKKQRLAREWETKIERDKKYVRSQPFGKRDNATILSERQLEEILAKGRAPSPTIDAPQELPINYPRSSSINGSNMYGLSQPPTYNSPPYTNFSNMQTNSSIPQNDYPDNSSYNFQRFYGPHANPNDSSKPNASSNSTTQPIKGDAHDPFLLFDPNKEGQNVFNIIPQQDLYDPWGRPGGGAPLIHQPTGQKFTRYSGSLQEKLNTTGPLGFSRKPHRGNIDEQRRDLEMEQRRRQQEEMEHRSNAGDTAEWISQIESNRFPLRLHLPTTQTTRELIGARERYRSEESRMLHNDLIRQAEERHRNQQLNRYHNSIAELQHTETQNGWWGRGGGGAPTFTNRRHNVSQTLEHSRQKWTMNHMGQLVIADDGSPGPVKIYDADYYYPKTKGFSSHRNNYQLVDGKKF